MAIQHFHALLLGSHAAIALDHAFGDQDATARAGQPGGGPQLVHRRRADPVGAAVLARQQPAVLVVMHEEIAARFAAVIHFSGHILQPALLAHGAAHDLGKVAPMHACQGIEAQPGLLAAALDQPEPGGAERPDDEGQQ
ncbi:hypothetical protein D3C72_1723780 [compost metagenome]